MHAFQWPEINCNRYICGMWNESVYCFSIACIYWIARSHTYTHTHSDASDVNIIDKWIIVFHHRGIHAYTCIWHSHPTGFGCRKNGKHWAPPSPGTSAAHSNLITSFVSPLVKNIRIHHFTVIRAPSSAPLGKEGKSIFSAQKGIYSHADVVFTKWIHILYILIYTRLNGVSFHAISQWLCSET